MNCKHLAKETGEVCVIGMKVAPYLSVFSDSKEQGGVTAIWYSGDLASCTFA